MKRLAAIFLVIFFVVYAAGCKSVNEQFVEAIKLGDAAKVKALADKGADIWSPNANLIE